MACLHASVMIGGDDRVQIRKGLLVCRYNKGSPVLHLELLEAAQVLVDIVLP